MANSRIQKSLMNAQVNVVFYVISVILAFFSRKYFLQNLGTEFLGLSGTLGDMLNLMNITELGIGTAVGVTLYKPIFDKDHEKINDIISVFGFLYTRVGSIIAGVGIILSCFFPMMFAKAGVPLYLVYLMFYSMLYSALLGYFVNYKQIILSASQQNYVIMLRYNTAVTLKVILQILTSFLPYNYLWWIALEALTITIYTFILNGTIRKYFPWLETSVRRGKEKFKEYKNLWTKTKQVFCFKLAHIAFNSSANILIFSFASLTSVALYGNYNMLLSKVINFFDGLFIGMAASVGNLIAEGDKSRIMKVFKELMSFRYFIAGLCTITLYFCSTPIIKIWLGEKYEMPALCILLMCLHQFIMQARIAVDNFKDAYGIFNDYWAPLTEVVGNIVLAIIFGKLYGLVGILMAMVVSEFLIKMVWKPYYLYKMGFEMSVLKDYWPIVFKYLGILGVCIVLIYMLSNALQPMVSNMNLWTILGYCVIIGSSVTLILAVLFYSLDSHSRGFVKRLVSYRKGHA